MADTFKLYVENTIAGSQGSTFQVPVQPGQTMYLSLSNFQKTPDSGFSFAITPDPGTDVRVQSITVKGEKVSNDPSKNYYWRLYEENSLAHQDLNKVLPNVGDSFTFKYQKI